MTSKATCSDIAFLGNDDRNTFGLHEKLQAAASLTQFSGENNSDKANRVDSVTLGVPYLSAQQYNGRSADEISSMEHNKSVDESLVASQFFAPQLDFDEEIPWAPAYQRNNKANGQKNLRCFPAHCELLGHQRGFCGRSIKVNFRFRPETVKGHLFSFAYFTIADCELRSHTGIAAKCANRDRYVAGDIISYKDIENNIRSAEWPLLDYVMGMELQDRQTNSDGIQNVRFEFNRNLKGWHYGFLGNKLTRNLHHSFRVCVLEQMEEYPGIEKPYRVLAHCSSPDWTLYCRRRNKSSIPTFEDIKEQQRKAFLEQEYALSSRMALSSSARVPDYKLLDSKAHRNALPSMESSQIQVADSLRKSAMKGSAQKTATYDQLSPFAEKNKESKKRRLSTKTNEIESSASNPGGKLLMKKDSNVAISLASATNALAVRNPFLESSFYGCLTGRGEDMWRNQPLANGQIGGYLGRGLTLGSFGRMDGSFFRNKRYRNDLSRPTDAVYTDLQLFPQRQNFEASNPSPGSLNKSLNDLAEGSAERRIFGTILAALDSLQIPFQTPNDDKPVILRPVQAGGEAECSHHIKALVRVVRILKEKQALKTGVEGDSWSRDRRGFAGYLALNKSFIESVSRYGEGKNDAALDEDMYGNLSFFTNLLKAHLLNFRQVSTDEVSLSTIDASSLPAASTHHMSLASVPSFSAKALAFASGKSSGNYSSFFLDGNDGADVLIGGAKLNGLDELARKYSKKLSTCSVLDNDALEEIQSLFNFGSFRNAPNRNTITTDQNAEPGAADNDELEVFLSKHSTLVDDES